MRSKIAIRSYWLDLFTHETWNEFIAAGATVTGFRDSRWRAVQNIKKGDILLCYLTGISRWIGVLEVVGPPYQDNAVVWKKDIFPSRLPVKLLNQLDPLTAVPVIDMRDRLSAFQDLKSPHAWTGRFRGSPTRWSEADGVAVMDAVREAALSPVERTYDRAKLKRRPPVLNLDSDTPVTVPDDDMVEDVGSPVTIKQLSEIEVRVEADDEVTAHTEIQWLLLKLGGDMGLDTWVARNDRNRSYNDRKFCDMPRLKKSLPLQFDEPTTRTIELIDVLWLKNNAIQAAFEIESTTSIFSGLLRMSDLITMQPNINIPLYIVAPESRRNKVISEINRPTFSRRDPPMSEMCRFIGFSALRSRYDEAKSFVRFLKPEFLEDLSEDCSTDEV